MSHSRSSSTGSLRKSVGRDFAGTPKSTSDPNLRTKKTASPRLVRKADSPNTIPSRPPITNISCCSPSSPLSKSSPSPSSSGPCFRLPPSMSSSFSFSSSFSSSSSQEVPVERRKTHTSILLDHDSQDATPLHNEFQISSHEIFDMDKKDIEYEFRISNPEEAYEFIKLIQEKLEIEPIRVIPLSCLPIEKLHLSKEKATYFLERVKRVSENLHKDLISLAELYPNYDATNMPKEKADRDKVRNEYDKVDQLVIAFEALDIDCETITDHFAFIPNRHKKDHKFAQTTRASIGKSETVHKARVSVKRIVLKREKPVEVNNEVNVARETEKPNKDCEEEAKKKATEAEEAEKIALREFVNCLTVDASLGFRPVFGFSGLVENGELTEIHIIEPWVPFTLQSLLKSNLKRNPGIETNKAEAVSSSPFELDPKVDLFLADEIQMIFQLFQIIEEMRFNHKILKCNVFAAHCDIKADNILVLRMPPPYGWLTLLFDVETSSIHTQVSDKNSTLLMSAKMAEITKARKKLNGNIREHLHDIDRLQYVISTIISDKHKKEPWYSKFEAIVKQLDSTEKGDQFNIFNVSLDFHLVCVWVLAGLCYEENSEALLERLKKMVNDETLCGDLCEIPDPSDFADVEPKPLFNWICVVQEGEGLNMRLKVKVGVSTQKPEGTVIYVSSEHITTQQTQTMVVICQILEHVFLLFPFDPDLASTLNC